MALSQGAMNDIALGRGGSYSLSRDVIAHNLWDTRYFSSATVDDHTFFTQPLGAPWVTNNKTINETNVSQAGQLPNGQTFLVKRIGIGLLSSLAAADEDAPDLVQAFINIIQSSVFEIVIAGREYDFQVHGRQFLPSVFVVGDYTDTQNNVAVTRVGDMIASGWIPLRDTPIFIDQLVNFKVTQKWDNPWTGAKSILSANATLLYQHYSRLQVTLEGVLTRAK